MPDARKLQVMGELGAKGAVRFDRVQNLTEAEKEQARTNIGIEEAIFNAMVALNVAPVILDNDDTVLVDDDGAILLNM